MLPNDLKLVQPTIAVVAGWANSFAAAVTIFRPSTGKKLDEFVCYAPSISPSGKYVAFFRFYQAHGPESAGASDSVALYQTTLAGSAKYAAQNWENKGTLMYPNPPDGLIHRWQSPITWSSDTQFSYVDSVGKNLYTVTVSLANGVPSVNRQRAFSTNP